MNNSFNYIFIIFQMLDMCEGLLDENFEKALEETVGSMQSKK